MSSLEIVIVAAGMPFAGNTLQHRSLGGSETAALSLGKALKERGHMVTVFCVLPPPGSPDFIGHQGGMDSDGVRYISMEQYSGFISQTEVDLLIVQRDPRLLDVPHQARKAVLWCHDLATYHGPSQAIVGTGWNVDEIWCVSNWHADQYANVSGYPRNHIKVLRNAITRQDVISFGDRDNHQLVYAARPERGLEALVRPGGIMSRLPEFKLKVAMYDNFPDHMRDYYGQLFSWAQALPNVEIMGSLTQLQLRTLMGASGGYIYPTNFEETSCIIAQEALEQNCVFMTTAKGALAETLKGQGRIFDADCEWGTDDFCEKFAEFVRETMSGAPEIQATINQVWVPRYWSDAALEVESAAFPFLHSRDFSTVWSLIEDSDVIPAIAYLENISKFGPPSKHVQDLHDRIRRLYPYLFGKTTFAEYYENYFVREDSKGARVRRSQVGTPRFEAISEQIAKLPIGAKVLDYGCAEGVIILDLAKRFPDKDFIGIDFAQTNVDLCRKYAHEIGLANASFHCGSTDDFPKHLLPVVDAVICTEVLEHVEKPWEVIGFLERQVKLGGRVITTVPAGPWEAIGLYDKEQYWWRAHIWHINKPMLREMFANKQGCQMTSLTSGVGPDGRSLGHLVFCYDADHTPPRPVDPLEKALESRHRQTVTACIISSGDDTIRKMLKSISRQVQVVKVLATDNYHLVKQATVSFADEHPWLIVECNPCPQIKAGVFGFDDARNASIQDIETDWVLWIDDDEYLVGDMRKYLRRNAFDSYAIHQHHFTCDPRGAPTQLDKPARLFRVDRGFKFYGKVHEHAEKGVNGGPGFAFILPDVDIGHTGYANEEVRRKRFERNFPFMEWDHKVNPDRNLGKFLWLRDIVHRMRYAAMQGDRASAHGFALEAIDYYKKLWHQWDHVGMGGEQALSYYSEALAFLGRGLPIAVQYEINGMKGQYSGVFEDEEEVLRILRSPLTSTFERRKSGYWQ